MRDGYGRFVTGVSKQVSEQEREEAEAEIANR